MHALQDAQRDAIRLRLMANRDASILARLKDDGVTSSYFLCVVQIAQEGVADDHPLHLFTLLDKLRSELIKAYENHAQDTVQPHPYAGAAETRVPDAEDLARMRWLFLWPNFNLHDALRDARISSSLEMRDRLGRTPGEQDFLQKRWTEEETALQKHGTGWAHARNGLLMFVKGVVYDREFEEPSGLTALVVLVLLISYLMLPPGYMPLLAIICLLIILIVAFYRALFPKRLISDKTKGGIDGS